MDCVCEQEMTVVVSERIAKTVRSSNHRKIRNADNRQACKNDVANDARLANQFHGRATNSTRGLLSD